MSNFKYVIGIDEAGRGPLAGPVSVGVALVPKDFDWDYLPLVNDSKKLSEVKREEIYKETFRLKKTGMLDFRVSMVSASVIDKIGISTAVARALARAINNLDIKPHEADVRLDGLLKAPSKYLNQQTIIKGDSKEKIIGLASIMAKVKRDRYMRQIAAKPQFSAYNFDIHKGYGTKSHRESIQKNGLSTLHRHSFCYNLLK